MKKRIDECLFCSSRSCTLRVSTPDDYVQIACKDHETLLFGQVRMLGFKNVFFETGQKMRRDGG